VPAAKTAICSQKLSSDDVEAFTYAITRHYWYELFMDDLPIWGFVGDIRPSKLVGEDDTVVLYTHKQLDISYNGDRVRATQVIVHQHCKSTHDLSSTWCHACSRKRMAVGLAGAGYLG
jgi:hypothetical protein